MISRRWFLGSCGVCVPLLLATDAPADKAPAGYGSVTGQFVLDGKAPPRRLIHRKGEGKDPSCCAKEDYYSDELLVDEKTKGIANVLVFLPHAAAVHPRLAPIPKEDVRIDVKGCRYVPYVAVVRSGQGLAFSSSDECVHAPAVYGAGFAPHGHVAPLTRPIRLVPRRRKDEKFLPAVLSCPIHPCMR